jgi:hypothetical protein
MSLWARWRRCRFRYRCGLIPVNTRRARLGKDKGCAASLLRIEVCKEKEARHAGDHVDVDASETINLIIKGRHAAQSNQAKAQRPQMRELRVPVSLVFSHAIMLRPSVSTIICLFLTLQNPCSASDSSPIFSTTPTDAHDGTVGYFSFPRVYGTTFSTNSIANITWTAAWDLHLSYYERKSAGEYGFGIVQGTCCSRTWFRQVDWCRS